MRILAIESAAAAASCAIWEDETVKALYSTNFKITHSQTLLPMIDEIMKMTSTAPESLDAIAVSAGPGSFTGLRIGSAAAKGLGFALDKPLIHVPTLDAMAYNFYGSSDLIVPIMDARRNQVYTGVYTFKEVQGCLQLSVLLESCAKDINELLGIIKENYFGKETEGNFQRVIFLGDGVPAFRDVIIQNANFKFMFAAPNQAYESASSVACLAAEYYKKGKIVTADEESPDYLRPSQAERVKAQKEGKAL